MFPPEAVAPARLRALRETLERLEYTAPSVCARAECKTIYDFRTLLRGRTAGTELNDPLDALIRLFMDGAAVPVPPLEQLLTPALLDELQSLELVGQVTTPAGEALRAYTLLYPTEGLYVASDLEFDPDVPEGRPDTVYPAITKSCEVHLTMVPNTPCEHFLEVCSGTGIAALRAARAGGHAWAVDITARSTAFARFNAALNGLENFTALQGDLYDPVAGLQFDRITAHPPYVPALEQRQIYRDGGPDGEQVSRRVFEGAHAHLKPGGRLYCNCAMTDREGAPLEERVRAMLGEGGAECDVVLLVSKAEDPEEYLGQCLVEHVLDLEAAQRFRDHFEELRVRQFVGASVIVERHGRPHAPVTLRRQQARLAAVNVDGLLHWKAYPQEPPALRQLAGIRPRLAPGARMEASHVVRGGQWELQRVRVAVDGALPVAVETSPEATVLLAWCDGTQTLEQLRQRLVAEGAAGPEAPLEDFAELVRLLLAAGVLEADLPPAA